MKGKSSVAKDLGKRAVHSNCRFLCAALHRYHGVISRVAEAVGLSRKSLYAKLDYLEIDYERYRLRS